jgi:hypothetical protein
VVGLDTGFFRVAISQKRPTKFSRFAKTYVILLRWISRGRQSISRPDPNPYPQGRTSRSPPDRGIDLEYVPESFDSEYEIPKYDGDLGRPSVFVPIEAEVCQKKVRYLMDAFESQRHKHWFQRETFAISPFWLYDSKALFTMSMGAPMSGSIAWSDVLALVAGNRRCEIRWRDHV